MRTAHDVRSQTADHCQWEHVIVANMADSAFATLKLQGNVAFQAQQWDEAITFYTDALEHSSTVDERCSVLSNRAAAYLKVGSLLAALTDADHSVDLVPTWVKGYMRKALALAGLGEVVRSEVAASIALALDRKLRRDEVRHHLSATGTFCV